MMCHLGDVSKIISEYCIRSHPNFTEAGGRGLCCSFAQRSFQTIYIYSISQSISLFILGMHLFLSVFISYYTYEQGAQRLGGYHVSLIPIGLGFDFNLRCVCAWSCMFSLWFRGFLPQFKDTRCRLIGVSKLSIVCKWVYECVCVFCDILASCPEKSSRFWCIGWMDG